jgi:hypothetical protein
VTTAVPPLESWRLCATDCCTTPQRSQNQHGSYWAYACRFCSGDVSEEWICLECLRPNSTLDDD